MDAVTFGRLLWARRRFKVSGVAQRCCERDQRERRHTAAQGGVHRASGRPAPIQSSTGTIMLICLFFVFFCFLVVFRLRSIALKDLVMLLLHHDADVCVINGEGRLPRDMTQQTSDNGREIIQLLRAAEQTEIRRREMRMLTAARDGNFAELNALVSPPECNVNERRPNNLIFLFQSNCAAEG